MSQRSFLRRDETLLSLVDYGGSGSPILLLHGLAGHGEEWAETAAWLRDGYRVVAMDMRGHGYSERRPADVSVHALVEDAVAAIDLIRPPVVLVGQSLGGIIALLVAAERPDLVAALVMIEASPAGMAGSAAAELGHTVAEQLRSWPVPFSSGDEAVTYFGGPSLSATAWVSGLEVRDDGLWPRFDVDVMERMLREVAAEPLWDSWERIRPPVLVVAGDPLLRSGDLERMGAGQPRAVFVKFAGAKHDVHLDQPQAWRQALSAFLKTLS